MFSFNRIVNLFTSGDGGVVPAAPDPPRRQPRRPAVEQGIISTPLDEQDSVSAARELRARMLSAHRARTEPFAPGVKPPFTPGASGGFYPAATVDTTTVSTGYQYETYRKVSPRPMLSFVFRMYTN